MAAHLSSLSPASLPEPYSLSLLLVLPSPHPRQPGPHPTPALPSSNPRHRSHRETRVMGHGGADQLPQCPSWKVDSNTWRGFC